MKRLLPLLTLFGSCRAADDNFLDFWRESNVMAFKIRDQISKNSLGNRFIKLYKNVREVTRFYQNEGVCASTISSPSYSQVISFKHHAHFDRKTNPGANMENLARVLGMWIDSYACVDDSSAASFDDIKKSLRVIKALNSRSQLKEYLGPQNLTWEISSDLMTYDQARAYCFSKGKWLANPDLMIIENNFDEFQAGAESDMTPGQRHWFNVPDDLFLDDHDQECWDYSFRFATKGREL